MPRIWDDRQHCTILIDDDHRTGDCGYACWMEYGRVVDADDDCPEHGARAKEE